MNCPKSHCSLFVLMLKLYPALGILLVFGFVLLLQVTNGKLISVKFPAAKDRGIPERTAAGGTRVTMKDFDMAVVEKFIKNK